MSMEGVYATLAEAVNKFEDTPVHAVNLDLQRVAALAGATSDPIEKALGNLTAITDETPGYQQTAKAVKVSGKLAGDHVSNALGDVDTGQKVNDLLFAAIQGAVGIETAAAEGLHLTMVACKKKPQLLSGI